MSKEIRPDIKGEYNILERIGSVLPGIAGYIEREKLCSADHRLRGQIADAVQELKRFVQQIQRKRLESGILRGLDALERLCARLDKLSETIRYSTSGYSGVFDGNAFNSKRLESIVNYDLEMSASLVRSREIIERASGSIGQETNLDEVLNLIEKEIDILFEAVECRKLILQGCEQETEEC